MSPPNALAAWKANRSLTTTGATSADTGIIAIATGAHKGGGIQVSGTFSATLQFEQSQDGGVTWIAKTVYPALGGAGVTSTTAGGNWKFACGGETNVRVRCSAYTSGTAAVSMVLTKGAPDVAQGGAGTAGSPSGGVQSVQAPEDGVSLTKASVTMTGSSGALVSADATRKIVIVTSAASNAAAVVDPTGGTAALDAGLPLSGGGMLTITGKQAQSAMTQIGTNTQKLTVYTG